MVARRHVKKWTTFAIVYIIIMELFISASAEEQQKVIVSGSGRVEGIIEPYIYQVVLPTYVEGAFDFIMDPQRLIEETNAAAYDNLSFEKGASVFFHRSDGKAEEDYSSSSDCMNIVNRSNVPIDVFVNVKVSEKSMEGITMTSDKTFMENTGASLYMALTDGENTVPVEKGTAFLRATLPAAPEEAFEYVYDQEYGKYNYGLKEDLSDIEFPEYSFQLTGAVNKDEGWSSVGKATPSIEITWKVMPKENFDMREEKETEPDTYSGEELIFYYDNKSEPDRKTERNIVE